MDCCLYLQWMGGEDPTFQNLETPMHYTDAVHLGQTGTYEETSALAVSCQVRAITHDRAARLMRLTPRKSILYETSSAL